MSLATLRRGLTRLRHMITETTAAATPAPTLELIRQNPAQILSQAGLTPDPWQSELLRSWDPRVLMLCSRQAGKSQTAAALVLRSALLEPGLILLLSPTQRQSVELFRDKVLPVWRALGCPFAAGDPTQLSLELANGSRILVLPGEEKTIRSFSSVRLLVIDEAARVPDSLYYPLRPMLAVGRGRLVALSSAYAKTGWFYQEWTDEKKSWKRVKITAEQCPRITAEFLAEERATMPERIYRMEYHCEFGDATDAVFREEDLLAAISEPIPPLFEG